MITAEQAHMIYVEAMLKKLEIQIRKRAEEEHKFLEVECLDAGVVKALEDDGFKVEPIEPSRKGRPVLRHRIRW